MPGAKKNFIGLEGFIWWIGVVEDRQDPEQLGRVRVRCFGWHTEDKNRIPTETLPWSHPVIPVNNPTAYTPKEGDMVFGFFIDGDSAQNPVIVGVLPGKPDAKPDYSKGFSDPRTDFGSAPKKPDDAAEAYPKGKYVKEQTTSRLSRGATDGTIVSTRKKNQVTSIKSAGGVSWDEPTPAYATKYPYNSVLETESGHTFELDDTPGAERVQLAHRDGSYIEMDQNGNRAERVQKDNYEVIMGSDYVYIKGACSVTIGGDCNLKVVGKVNMEAAEINMSATGDVKIRGGGAVKIESGSGTDVKAGAALKISGSSGASVQSGGTVAITGSTVGVSSPFNVAGATNLKAAGIDSHGDNHNLPVKGSGAASASAADDSGLSAPTTGPEASAPSETTPPTSGSTAEAVNANNAAVGKDSVGQTSTISPSFNSVNTIADGVIKDLDSNLPINELTNNVQTFQNVVNSERGNILSMIKDQKDQILGKINTIATKCLEKNIPFDLNVDIQNQLDKLKTLKNNTISAIQSKIGKHIYPSTETLSANT